MIIFEVIVAFIFGAVLGSFACCQARRLRLAEKGKKDPGKWSVCLSCGKKLTWYENIPIFSWLFQLGRCRKCKKKIGATEFLAEVFTGLTFAVIMAWFNGLWRHKCGFLGVECSEFNFIESVSYSIPAIVDCVLLMLLFAILTAMVVLFIYDAKWQLMPTKVLIIVNILAVIFAATVISAKAIFWPNSFDFAKTGTDLLITVAELAGLYFLMYFASHEKLVGGGDWILALAISLVLANWWFGLLVLFLSNALASLIMLPFSFGKKQKQICFGPFLILAFLIVFVGQEFFISIAQGLLF